MQYVHKQNKNPSSFAVLSAELFNNIMIFGAAVFSSQKSKSDIFQDF